jgi:hypothetical protein
MRRSLGQSTFLILKQTQKEVLSQESTVSLCETEGSICPMRRTLHCPYLQQSPQCPQVGKCNRDSWHCFQGFVHHIREVSQAIGLAGSCDFPQWHVFIRSERLPAEMYPLSSGERRPFAFALPFIKAPTINCVTVLKCATVTKQTVTSRQARLTFRGFMAARAVPRSTPSPDMAASTSVVHAPVAIIIDRRARTLRFVVWTPSIAEPSGDLWTRKWMCGGGSIGGFPGTSLPGY